MARRRVPSRSLPEPLQRFVDRAEGVLRFQERYVEQVKDYTARVGDLTSSRSVDPGEWIESYSLFLSRVVRDFGDWVLDRQSLLAEEAPLVRAVRKKKKRKERFFRYKVGTQPIPVARGKLRVKEGATGVPLYVPPGVYAALKLLEPSKRRKSRKRGRAKATPPTVTLMTDGFLPEGGGVPLSRNNVAFAPKAEVPASRPEAELKITDVEGALKQDTIYRGFVWVKETKQVIAAVEIKVL
jgi:hypothetical protein